MKAMKRYIIAIIGLMLCCGLRAQTRTCRYWFDGNLEQSVTTSFSGNVWDTEIDVSQLPDGIHSLHYYLTDTTSTPVKGYFFHKVSNIGASSLEYRYWFDNHHNNLHSGTVGNGTFQLDVSNLATGLHTLHLIVKGSNYSATRSYLFIKTDIADLDVNLSYHCWFDEDFGHQQTGTLGDGNLLLDVTALEDGEHVVRIFLEGSTVAAPQCFIFTKHPATADTYEITATAVPAEGGTITGAGTYYENNTCILTATPNEGYSFICWKENGSVVSQEATYTFTVTGNRNLVAQFSGTGVDEYEGESLVLYPNPVNDMLFVESIGITRKCEVYSLSGQLMLSLTECSERLEVPVENLPTGAYMVRLVTDRFVKTSKFVKK